MLSAGSARVFGPCWHICVVLSRTPYGRLFHATPRNQQLQKGKSATQACYRLLNVEEDCEDSELREAYIKLAKKYHPDSDSDQADATKFAQVTEAYQSAQRERQIAEGKTAEEVDEVVEFDIKHTAPQHRQYLSYEGVGSGTPSKRQRQYQQYRVSRASDNVYEYRTQRIANKYEGALVSKDKKATRKKTIRSAMDRLVEDLIQESMAKGEFDNLPGKGKKLEYTNFNPFVDTVTHNLNRILIDNGYSPEWIVLEKEIRGGIRRSRSELLDARKRLGKNIISPTEKIVWDRHRTKFVQNLDEINKKINKFNLVAPTLRQQIFPLNESREVQKVLDRYNELLSTGQVPEVVDNKDSGMSTTHGMVVTAVTGISFAEVWKDIKALFASYKDKKT